MIYTEFYSCLQVPIIATVATFNIFDEAEHFQLEYLSIFFAGITLKSETIDGLNVY